MSTMPTIAPSRSCAPPSTTIPTVARHTSLPITEELVAGFSHEYIGYMQGGLHRSSFRPLNDAVIAGRIRGLAGVVGCNNARVPQD